MRNVKVVALPDGSGTLVGFVVNHGESADGIAGISVNNQLATLTSLTGGQLVLEKNKPIFFEGDSANAKGKIAKLGAVPGQRVPVVFYFAIGGKITLDALVVANTGIYNSIL